MLLNCGSGASPVDYTNRCVQQIASALCQYIIANRTLRQITGILCHTYNDCVVNIIYGPNIIYRGSITRGWKEEESCTSERFS